MRVICDDFLANLCIQIGVLLRLQQFFCQHAGEQRNIVLQRYVGCALTMRGLLIEPVSSWLVACCMYQVELCKSTVCVGEDTTKDVTAESPLCISYIADITKGLASGLNQQ